VRNIASIWNQYAGYLIRLLMWAIVSIVGIWAPCLIDLWYGVLDSRMGFVVCAAMPFVLCGTIVSLITLPELFDQLSSQKGRYKWR